MAHTGVAHEDFVDIKVAYIIVAFLFITIFFLGWALPTPAVVTDLTQY